MGDRAAKIDNAKRTAADAVLWYATETAIANRPRVALAGAYLLHDTEPGHSAIGAAVATLEGALALVADNYAASPSPKLALAALEDAERALSAIRALLAEVCR